MAGIHCEFVGENDAAVTVKRTLRASRRQRMDLIRPFKIVADAAIQLPSENDRERQKLDRDLFLSSVSSRGYDNAVQNSDTNNLTEDHGINETVKFGTASVCGRRRDMEDAVSIHPSFCKLSSRVRISSDVHFFGVFDGHGCTHVLKPI